LRLVVGGRSNDGIAEALGISRHTVRTHLQNIMAKMLVRSRTELVSVAMRSGMRTGTGPVTHDG
jgi:two-component system NarL family response regulator